MPCETLRISTRDNSVFHNTNFEMRLWRIYFPSRILLTEEKYLYNFENLLAEIGGFLGLVRNIFWIVMFFLGYVLHVIISSTKSLLNTITTTSPKVFVKMHQTASGEINNMDMDEKIPIPPCKNTSMDPDINPLDSEDNCLEAAQPTKRRKADKSASAKKNQQKIKSPNKFALKTGIE